MGENPILFGKIPFCLDRSDHVCWLGPSKRRVEIHHYCCWNQSFWMRPSKCGLSHEKIIVWLVIVGDYTNYINYSISWEILGVSIFLESRYEDHGMTWGYWPCSSRIFIQRAPGVLRFPKKRGDPQVTMAFNALWLVVLTPLKNDGVRQLGSLFPTESKVIKTCSKPPTSY